ncbi:MAG: hypothetical protein EB168_03550 [Euryarchaeota archaeon]|nr:hypothetical protein [Euryarchaeota archaeon]
MAGIFENDLLNGFLGSEGLKDFRHGSKTFRSGGYALAPRYKFLFHVYFNLNVAAIPGLRQLVGRDDQDRLSLLVKNIQLPNYTIETDTLNQYNRKRLVQNKIEYDPVTITFHDDHSDLARKLWFNYFSYYYKDANQPYNANIASNTALTNQAPGARAGYNDRDTYADQRAGNDWGYSGEGGAQGGKPYFFRDITIYGMSQHDFVSYTLINPHIISYRHDTYDYSDGGTPMQNTMELRYETVKYGSGKLNGSTGAPIPGFADSAYYDKTPSSLSRPGSNTSVLGQGGLIDAGLGIFDDLSSGNLLGAAIKTARVSRSIDRDGIKGVKEELKGAIIRQGLPAAVKAIQTIPVPKRQGPTTPTFPGGPTPILATPAPNPLSLDLSDNNLPTNLVNSNTNAVVNTAGGRNPGTRGYSARDLVDTTTNADGTLTRTTKQTLSTNAPTLGTAIINPT